MKTTKQTTKQQTTKHKQTTDQYICSDSSDTSSDANSIHGDGIEEGVKGRSSPVRSESGDSGKVQEGGGEVGEEEKYGRKESDGVSGDIVDGDSGGDNGVSGASGDAHVHVHVGVNGDSVSGDNGDRVSGEDGVTSDVRRRLEREHLTDSSDDQRMPLSQR